MPLTPTASISGSRRRPLRHPDWSPKRADLNNAAVRHRRPAPAPSWRGGTPLWSPPSLLGRPDDPRPAAEPNGLLTNPSVRRSAKWQGKSHRLSRTLRKSSINQLVMLNRQPTEGQSSRWGPAFQAAPPSGRVRSCFRRAFSCPPGCGDGPHHGRCPSTTRPSGTLSRCGASPPWAAPRQRGAGLSA